MGREWHCKWLISGGGGSESCSERRKKRVHFQLTVSKQDRSSNALDTWLVESLGYFLPDEPRSVSESNPNSEDESKSEDRSVAKKGRK